VAKEILAVSEENLAEVIRVIRAGLKAEKVSKEVRLNLSEWCKDEEEYLKEMGRGEI
jgi:hypothetical protein